MRRTALVAGLVYLIIFAASIPAVFLLAAALGFVTSRMLEAAILIGLVSLLTVVTLGRDRVVATEPIWPR